MKPKDTANDTYRNALHDVADVICSEAGESTTWLGPFYRNQQDRLLSDIALCAELGTKSDLIVDIGSAPFFTTAALSRLGYNIVGVDIAPERFQRSLDRIGLKVLKCNFEVANLPFDDNSVDLVLLSEVFEHLRIDLISTMREIRRVIKPGGYLLVSTPNVLSLPKLRRMLINGRTCDIYAEYEKLHKFGHMGHVREYAPQDLITFFSRIGFKTTRTIYRGSTRIRLRPTQLFTAIVQRLAPRTRRWFMLVLQKVDNDLH